MSIKEEIIFCCIASGSIQMVEVMTARAKPYTDTIQKVLEKIPKRQGKMTYALEKFKFHYMVDEKGVVFLCMADENASTRLCFAFLEGTKAKFTSHYGDPSDFKSTLFDQMKYYNNPKNDKIKAIRQQIDETKNVMVDNIEKVLERGEKIEVLVAKTEELNIQAQTFKKQAVAVKRKMWWKNIWLWILMAGVFLVIVGVITMFACGGISFPNCQIHSSPSSSPPSGPTKAPSTKAPPAPPDGPTDAPPDPPPPGPSGPTKAPPAPPDGPTDAPPDPSLP